MELNQRHPGVPQVGTGILVIRTRMGKSELLLGKRKGAHGSGEWSLPGGRLDYGETCADGAARELYEETNIKASKHDMIPVHPYTEDYFPDDNLHFITLYFYAHNWTLQGSINPPKEPHKCEEWKFFPIDELPKPLFINIEKNMNRFIRQLKMAGYLKTLRKRHG